MLLLPIFISIFKKINIKTVSSRNVFKDKKIELKFQQSGFVVLPLLNSTEINQLIDFYNNNPNSNSGQFHSTHFSKNRAYKRKVQQTIFSIFELHLKNLLLDYQLIFGNFMVKESGENSTMPLHADWTYVDENRFQSLGIWCPLVDTNAENGMLGVVPNSHQLKKNNRGPKIPSPFHDYNQYIIDNFGKLLPMKAGEVVIYDHRLLHFSPPNLSQKTRTAINIVASPKEAELFHYAVIKDPEIVEVFEVTNTDFFLEYDHFEQPDLISASKNLKLDVEKYTLDYLQSILKKKSLIELFLNFLRR
jgi:hypothetical protein